MSVVSPTQKTKMEELLESRRSKKIKLKHGSGHDNLRQRVFQVIAEHERREDMLREGLNPKAELRSGQAQCQRMLEDEDEEEDDAWNSIKSLIKMLKENISDNTASSSGPLINKEKLECVNTVITMLKHIIYNKNIEVDQVMGLIEKQVFPVEVWWMLNKAGIYSINKFLFLCSVNEDMAEHLTSQLYQLIHGDKETLNRRGEILKAYVESLIHFAFPVKKTDQYAVIRRTSMKILDGITKGILVQSTESDDTEEGVTLHIKPPDHNDNITIYKKFFTHTLSFTMSYSPNIKVSEALKNQDKWKSAKTSQIRTQLYKQLFLLFEGVEVVDILQRILERQEVNWENVLNFLSTFLVCFTEAPRLIEDHVYRLLKDSLDQCEMENTLVAFLLVRQSCIEGLHVFPSYQTWFHKTFGELTKSPADSKKSFNFLIKFLTNIVPFESAVYLKAHIVKPPSCPVKCREILSEYITLAKTRLADLMETTEDDEGGGRKKLTSTKEEQTETDVEKAVAAFQATGKIPATVLEASIFRKPYFVGKFLPVLLKPRPLPDVADAKMKMIKTLRKMEKITPNVYLRYQAECEREAKNLMQGVFMVNDSDEEMDELLLPRKQQLSNSLQKLGDCVRTEVTTGTKVPEILSVICEKIENCLKSDESLGGSPETSRNDGIAPHITIDLNYPDLDPAHVEVVDVILNFICKMICSDLQSKRCSDWLNGLVAVIGQNEALHKALYIRLMTFFTCKSCDLLDHHMTGISGLVNGLMYCRDMFKMVRLADREVVENSDILHVLVSLIARRCSPSFLLRFLSQYLRFHFLNYDTETETKEQVLPIYLIKQFVMLCWREYGCIVKSSPLNNEAAISYSIYSSNKLQNIISLHPISFEEWLIFEGQLHITETISSSERFKYQMRIVQDIYLKGNRLTVKQMCSLLLGKCVDGRNNSSCDFIHLLQNLVYLLPASKEGESPWLQSSFTEYVKMVEGTEEMRCGQNLSHHRLLSLSFFSVVVKLPSYLLFTNQPQSISSNLISTASNFILKYIKPVVNESFYLPVHFLSYILQGLSTLQYLLEDKTVIKQFLSEHFIQISSVIHWPLVGHFYADFGIYQPGKYNELNPEFRQLIEEEGYEEFPVWNQLTMAACLYRYLDRRNFEGLNQLEWIFHEKAKNRNDVVVILVKMLISCYCVNVYKLKDTKMVNCEAAINSILIKQPHVLSMLNHDLGPGNTEFNFIEELASEEVKDSWSFSLLRCISTLNDENLKTLMIEAGNIDYIVFCFHDLTQQFTSLSQILNLPDVVTLSQFVKKCLEVTPRANKTHLDQSVVMSCGFGRLV